MADETNYNDPTGLEKVDYDQSKVSPEVKKHTKNVRHKMYGRHVRESIARAIEVIDLTAQSALNFAKNAFSKSEDTENRLDNQIRDLTSDSEIIDFRYSSVFKKTFNILKDRGNFWDEEFKGKYLNVRWFGAKGDGVTDDTKAIQSAIEFARKLKLDVIIYFPFGTYIVTKPIITYTFEVDETIGDQWWFGSAILLQGHNKATANIVKINDSKVTADQVDNDSKYIGIDTTILTVLLTLEDKVSSEKFKGTGSGAGIDEMTITNKSDKGYSLFGYACQRANYTNLNIQSFYGMDVSRAFSSKFDNIVFNCKENAFRVDAFGTSNYFNRLYSYKCNNPFYIRSTYSVIDSIYADDCTGTLFTLGGGGQTINTLGCESPKATTIVAVYDSVVINTMYMHRPTEDTPKPIFLVNGDINVTSLHVTETVKLPDDTFTPLYQYNNQARKSSFSIGNISYSFTYDNKGRLNPYLKIDTDKKNMPDTDTATRFNNKSGTFNLRKGNRQPYIGARDGIDAGIDLPKNMKLKAIYMDNETDRSTSQGSVVWEQAYNTGDVLLYNDPKTTGIFAGVVTGKSANENSVAANTFGHVQLILSGTTSERPKNPVTGMIYCDQTLIKVVWFDGANWRDFAGVKS